MGQVDGKVVLITGAARGQGRSHALTLAREGADLILVDAAAQIDSVPYELATPEDLAETVAEVEKLDRRALAFQADIRDQAAIDDAVAKGIAEFGRIDALVANAGIWSIGDFWELTDQEWDDNLAVNLTGHWRTAKAVAPHMIERGEGSIVTIASVNGLEAAPRFAHYGAAKAGLLGLMRTMAVELGPHGVRCNAICPGAMDTTMNTWQGALDFMSGKEGGTLEDRRVGGRHWTMLKGRSMLSPSSTSAGVLWLVSDATVDVTGVVLPIDGGHMIVPGYNPSPA
jgi:SDR family mycofactocin-dependent oxidoreductase